MEMLARFQTNACNPGTLGRFPPCRRQLERRCCFDLITRIMQPLGKRFDSCDQGGAQPNSGAFYLKNPSFEQLRPYPPSILLRLRELDEIMDRHFSLCAHRNGDEAKQKRLGRLLLRSGKFRKIPPRVSCNHGFDPASPRITPKGNST